MSLLLFLSFESAAAPTVFAPPPLPVSTFAALVEQADRNVQTLLGGETITYTPEGGDAVPVVGLFDAMYVLAKGDAEAGAESLGPAVFLRLEDLPTDPEDDDPTLTIRGINYRVVERRPDGIGGIVLPLRFVS